MSKVLIEQAADEHIKEMFRIFFQRQDLSDGAIRVLNQKVQGVRDAMAKLLKGLKDEPMP